MTTVGAVWINVLPSMQGFASNLGRQATSAAKVAAVAPGRALGQGMSDEVGKTIQRTLPRQSKLMADTFTRSTNVMTRGLSNFRAGFRDVDAAASAFTGRMGTLGGVASRAVTPGVQAVGRFAGGFRDAQVAASAFSGRLGALGGLARTAVQPVLTGAQNLAAGFTSSAAAASAFTGRLGTVGGMARSAIQPAVTGAQNLHAGFMSSAAAASAFTGQLGTVGGMARTAIQPAITAVGAVGRGMATVGTTAGTAFSAVRSGAGTAFSAVRNAGTAAFGAVRSGAASMAAGAQSSVGGIGSSLTRMGAIGAAAVSAIGFAGLGRTALSAASDIQQASASMAGLYGSTQLADDMMRRLRDYSRDTPLETQSLYDAGSNLAYLGLEGEQAMGVIENVGTAMMAAGNTSESAMGNVTQALLSMQSAGQLYAGDIQKVSNEMVPAWDMLAEHMGMSIADVRAEVTAGNLTVDDFVAALQAGDGDYFEMMRGSAESTSQTFAAQFAQVKDNVITTLGETLLPLVDRAAPAMGRLGEAMEGGLRALPGVMSSIASAVRGAGLVEGFQSLVTGAREFGAAALPAVRSFGEVVGGAFLGALQVMQPLGSLLQSMAGWMRENEGVVRALGAALGGAVAAIVAIRVATTAWAVAQWALNAAMTANPIGIIIVAIAALVAGLIYAYQNFEGFRNVIDTVASAVKTAALWIWDNGLKPAFEGISAAVSVVGDAAMWLWENALQPAFSAIVTAVTAVGTAATWLWENAIQPAFNFIDNLIRNVITAIITVALIPLMAQFRVVSTVVMWLWESVIQPAFQGIAALALWLWHNALQPAWNGIMAGIRAVGAVFRWLRDNIVQPVFQWIQTRISNWWSNTRALFNTVINFIRTSLGTVFTWFRDNIIRPVWNTISSIIEGVWDNGIKPIFDLVMEGVDAMADAFEVGKDAISEAWEGIKDSAKTPVNFLIDTVFNDGIRPLWNRIAGIVGADEIDTVPTFAVGGPVYGAGTATSDSIPALLSNNEHVWTAREVQAAGGHRAVEAIRHEALATRSTYRAGGQVSFPGAPTIPSAKSLLDAVTDFLAPESIFALGGDIITGNYEGAIDRVLKPARDVTGEIGTSGLPGTPHLIVKKGGELLQDKIKDLIEAWNASFSSGGGSDSWIGFASASERLQRAATWADTQHGLPYQWGGGGNPSWDCSGFMAGIENVIRGLTPGRRYTTHSFAGTPPAGWQRGLNSPFTVGVQHGGRGGGHMAGTLLGKNVESGGRGVVTGTSARGTGSFPHRFGFRRVVGDMGGGSNRGSGGGALAYDSGGYVQPGVSLVTNQTGKPEPVLTSAQWRDMHRLAESVGSGEGGELMRDAHIHLENSEATVQEAFRRVDVELRKRRRGGVHAGRAGG